MRSRVIAVFLVGVLFGVVLLGGGVVALQHFGDDTQAQEAGTWQVEYLGTDSYIDDVEAWVSTLPAECDLVASDQTNLFYYRCPSS